MNAYENQFEYRGYTIKKVITKIGATFYSCEIDGSRSREVDPNRIVDIIDQKLAQRYLNSFPKLSKF